MKIFIIMAFDKSFDDVYEMIKACAQPIIHGDCYCKRLDEIEFHGKITDQLLYELKKCDLCVADLTGNNPNVLYEVGFAMALNKRIMFLSQDENTMPFDIKDMKTHFYKRNNLVLTLKEKLIKAFKYEYDNFFGNEKRVDIAYFNAEKKDSNEIEPYQLDRPKFQRGSFSNFLVDAYLSVESSMNPIRIHSELIDKLTNESAEIDLRYHYLGIIGASNWLDLSQHPEYEHSELKKTLNEHLSDVVEVISKEEDVFEIISLGPGDGDIDLKFINESVKRSKCKFYYGIDISFELLQKSFSNFADKDYLTERIKMKAIHGDFNYLSRYKPIYMHHDYRNVFSLLGFTFGNHQEAELIGKIRAGMEHGDYLLLDARLHNEELIQDERTSKSKTLSNIRGNYSHTVNNKFAFGPLELISNLKFNDVKDKFSIKLKNSITVVPNAINIITSLDTSDKNKIIISKTKKKLLRKEINLASTTIYDYEKLIEFFRSRNF